MLQLQKTFTNALAAQVKAQTGRRASIYTLALKRSLPWPKAKIHLGSLMELRVCDRKSNAARAKHCLLLLR